MEKDARKVKFFNIPELNVRFVLTMFIRDSPGRKWV